jgi:hypothetical protein
MPTTAKRRSRKYPVAVQHLEASLFNVLKVHYYVNRKRFEETSPQNMLKHEVCHLIKAVNKVNNACIHSTAKEIQVIKSEVVADLIIYALEIAIAFDLDWWSLFASGKKIPPKNALRFLARNAPDIDIEQQSLGQTIRNDLLNAAAKLGDFCDKNDHHQESDVDLLIEVVKPLIMSSLLLSKFYRLNIDEQYRVRLIDVQNKYVGQPGFNNRSNLVKGC